MRTSLYKDDQPANTIQRLLHPAPEAAEILGGVSLKTLYNHTFPRGALKSVKIGSRVMYSRASLEQFIAQQEQAAQSPAQNEEVE